MIKKITLITLIIWSANAQAQSIRISGNILDTAINQGIEGAEISVIRIRDSVLVKYARTDKNGNFNISSVPIDTFRVLFAAPNKGDQEIILVGNPQKLNFEFNNLVLPPKSIELKEIQIYGYSDPVFYKGDTLVYMADSFKVKENAMVEDLLKKLPGIKVDKQGGIKAQGTDIDKVLVDGDEFFGSDATMATQNLNASAIESVQIYDKENSNSGNENGKDKVLDLKLKAEAKNGYFGKVDVASDASKFYETTALLNKFNMDRKFSVFGMMGNTQKSSLSFQDLYKFNLSNEMNSYTDESGNTYMYGDQSRNTGIPRTVKTGIYYTDKINKNTKLNLNYSFGQSDVKSIINSRSTYFLSDSSFSSVEKNISSSKKIQHKVGFLLEKDLDSLNKITLESKINVNPENNTSINIVKYYDEFDSLKRSNEVFTSGQSEKIESQNSLAWDKKFKKKDRIFYAKILFNSSQTIANGKLISTNYLSDNSGGGDSINQQKTNRLENYKIGTELRFYEPLTKKSNVEFRLSNSINNGSMNRKSIDFVNGEYSAPNPNFSNNFENVTYVNNFRSTYIFEIKKKKISVGSNFRNTNWENRNLDTDSSLKLNFNNVLPFAILVFKFSDNDQLSFNYALNSNQPSLSQLQPLADNSNPNRVLLGNLKLKQSIDNRFSINYNTYKPLSGNYSYLNFSFTQSPVNFGDSTNIDSLGRSISKSVNVKNTNYTSLYYSFAKQFFDGILSVQPGLSGNYSNNKNYLNGLLNETQNLALGGSLGFEIEAGPFDIGLDGNYDKNYPSSTLENYKVNPYSTYSYTFDVEADLPKDFLIEAEASYYKNQELSSGFNTNYTIVNAKIEKKLLSTKNLILGFEVNDLLNQQTDIKRQVSGNVITDTNNNLIQRYYLARVIYRFNNNKTKESGNVF